jgi:hypothetical protein
MKPCREPFGARNDRRSVAATFSEESHPNPILCAGTQGIGNSSTDRCAQGEPALWRARLAGGLAPDPGHPGARAILRVGRC